MNPPRAKQDFHHTFTSLDNQLSQSFSIAQIFFIFIALDFPYQYGFRFVDFFDSVNLALIDATLFTSILWVTTRLDLARVTLVFLAMPYLFFIPGWLNLPVAATVLTIFLYCVTSTLRTTVSVSNTSITTRDILAFILIVIWINLSGAGGYGHQTPDYQIHLARLKDLIDYPWPVHYDENKNLVYYVGYFLPSAIIGKISNVDVAFRSMYPWTLFGVALAVRWLSFLSHWRLSVALVCIFIFFGPLDIPNVLALDHLANTPLTTTFATLSTNTDWLDFRTRYEMGFFIGSYPSNTFQLFWSPHQVIAGWLCMSLLTYLFLKKQVLQIVFVYALLCLWSPLIMIAMFPFVLMVILSQCWDKTWRNIITLENALGAGVLGLLFLIFYLGGGLDTLPSPFIFENPDWKNKIPVLVLFYLFTWGAYAITQLPFIAQQGAEKRIWFMCLAMALLLLPLKQLGAYSDLLCRGSAPLMFLLLVFILQSLKYYWQQKKWFMLMALSGLLLLGLGSASLQLRTAVIHYGQKAPVGNIVNYKYSGENLGADDTLFNRYLRKKLPEKAGAK